MTRIIVNQNSPFLTTSLVIIDTTRYFYKSIMNSWQILKTYPLFLRQIQLDVLGQNLSHLQLVQMIFFKEGGLFYI